MAYKLQKIETKTVKKTSKGQPQIVNVYKLLSPVAEITLKSTEELYKDSQIGEEVEVY